MVAAAVCPHPPLLVPEIAAGAAAELDDLRAACDAAVTRLLAAQPDVIVVVGTGSVTGRTTTPCWGTFGPWGVPVEVAFEPPGGHRVTDLSLRVKLQQAFAGSGGASAVAAQPVFLADEFVAFPRAMLGDIEKLVKKAGHIIKTVHST